MAVHPYLEKQSPQEVFERCLSIDEENTECLRGQYCIVTKQNNVARSYLESIAPLS